jgi:transcription elongation factor Elf1
MPLSAGGPMRTIITPREWKFEKEVVCFHCQTKATQVLRIGDGQGIVTCLTCGAQRHYVIRSVIYGTDTPPMSPLGMKYDAWDFEKQSACVHCKEQAVHTVHLDEYKMNVVCDECGFSRVFKLDHLILTQE